MSLKNTFRDKEKNKDLVGGDVVQSWDGNKSVTAELSTTNSGAMYRSNVP